jgi:hypothetical protein
MPPDALAADNVFDYRFPKPCPLTLLRTFDAPLRNIRRKMRRRHKPTQPQPRNRILRLNQQPKTPANRKRLTDGEMRKRKMRKERLKKPELPAIEPPRFWDAEAKKRFGELPRDIQELLVTKRRPKRQGDFQILQEAAEARKAAAGEASNLVRSSTGSVGQAADGKARFKSKWENVDWNAVIDQYGAEQALKFKNEFEADQAASSFKRAKGSRRASGPQQLHRKGNGQTTGIARIWSIPRLGPATPGCAGQIPHRTGYSRRSRFKARAALETSLS